MSSAPRSVRRKWTPLAAGLFLGAALFLTGFLYVLSGCPNPRATKPSGELSAVAPDEKRVARVERVGNRYQIGVRPFTDWKWGKPLPDRPTLWRSDNVPVRYLFWLDDETLEVLVLETDRSGFDSIRARSVGGVRVVTRAILTTAMATVLDSEQRPELVIGPLSDD